MGFPQKNIEGKTKKLSTPQAIGSPTFDGWVEGISCKGNTGVTRKRGVKANGCVKKAFQKKR